MDEERFVVGGSLRKVLPPDVEVREICEKIRNEVETRAGRSFSEFTPIHFKIQVAEGANFFIKVRVEANECVHVRVYKTLQNELALQALEEDKSLQEAVDYMECQ